MPSSLTLTTEHTHREETCRSVRMYVYNTYWSHFDALQKLVHGNLFLRITFIKGNFPLSTTLFLIAQTFTSSIDVILVSNSVRRLSLDLPHSRWLYCRTERMSSFNRSFSATIFSEFFLSSPAIHS